MIIPPRNLFCKVKNQYKKEGNILKKTKRLIHKRRQSLLLKLKRLKLQRFVNNGFSKLFSIRRLFRNPSKNKTF